MEERNGRSHIEMTYYRLVRQMTIWPTLGRENVQLRQGDVNTNPQAVLSKGLRAIEALGAVSDSLDEIINDRTRMGIKPTADPCGPVVTSFEVRDNLVARLVCHYAMFSVAVHRIVLSQLQATGGIRHNPEALENELRRQCHRIWMLIDYSVSLQPLGLPIMIPALILTYDLAEDTATRRKITDTMNEVDRLRSGKLFWEAAQIQHAANVLLGISPFGT